jgi:hypothetical protein
MTVMASKCCIPALRCFPVPVPVTASSSALNPRHTTATTLSDTLLAVTTTCVLNPIKTSAMRKDNIHKTQTDKVNTFLIAKTLMMQDSYRFASFYGLGLMNLKQLSRFHQKTIKQQTCPKIQLTSYIDQAFPELQYFFKSGLYQKAFYVLLKEVPTPRGIAPCICPIEPSPRDCLTRPPQEKMGERLKGSRAEVCRCQ